MVKKLKYNIKKQINIDMAPVTYTAKLLFCVLYFVTFIICSTSEKNTAIMDTPEMAKTLHKVFVYGTLKMGEPNHQWLTNTSNGVSNFLTKATTVDKYPLVIGTRYNIPFLLDRPGTGYRVTGELYEVDDSMLKNLDVLEDHPTFYERQIREIRNDDGSLASCWVYLLKKFPARMLDATTFLQSYSGLPPNLPYIDRSQRDPNIHAITDLV